MEKGPRRDGEAGGGGAARIRAPPSGDGGVDLPAAHVLVIDDEEAVRVFTAGALRHLGYTVSTCGDAEEAIQHYAQHRHQIDLVIVDLVMPRLSGLDVLRGLRRVNPDVKVLVSSGYGRHAAVQQMLSEGAVAFLSKPFGLDELSRAVAEHIF